MKTLIFVSLLVNIAVLVPVIAGMVKRAPWANACYGGVTPAREILLAVYGAFLISSIGLLIVFNPMMTAALLGVQVIYKIMTPFTTGDLRNPVVISNLAIAAFHSITFVAILA